MITQRAPTSLGQVRINFSEYTFAHFHTFNKNRKFTRLASLPRVLARERETKRCEVIQAWSPSSIDIYGSY